MKKQIFKIISLSVLFLSVSFSSAFANLTSVLTSQLPSGQRDNYQTDLFTGSADYSYPIKLPKGTNDLTPDVSLSYSSSGVHDLNLQAGGGWELNRDYIQRDVNYSPSDTSDDKYKLHFKGSTYELVYNSTEGLFHTTIEAHLKIQQFSSGGQGTTGIYWQVTTTDGTIYRFGYTSNSELICNGQNYDGYWNLDQVQDTHNNHIYYTYTQNNGLTYLSKITYNNDQQREIDFSYMATAYQRQAYIQGCNTTENSHLNTIQVKSNGNLVHEYDSNFSSSAMGMPLLSTLIEKGTDGTSALPSTGFDYNPEVQNWQVQSTDWDSNNSLDANLSMTSNDVRLLDVDGDGLPDIVKVTWSGGNDTYLVYKNLGNTWSNSPQTWLNNNPMDARPDEYWTHLIDVNGDGLPDIVKTANCNGSNSTWTVWMNTGTSWNAQPQTWVNNGPISCFSQTNNEIVLSDVNGDGLPDIVKSISVDGGNNIWQVYKNTGSSWNTTPETWVSNTYFDARIDQSNLTLIDVNGDGLPDIVKSIPTGQGARDTWIVYKNTGSGWNTTAETWLNNADIDANLFQFNTVFADVNGDGLPDIVHSVATGQGARNTWEVFMNTGSSWNVMPVSWLNNADIDSNLQMNDVNISDVNGDGLPDIVKSFNTGGPNNTWRVWQNNGYAPNALSTIHNEQGGSTHFDYTSSTKFNNNGKLPFALWIVQKMTENNGMTNGQQTNDVTTYNYSKGLYSASAKEFRGFGEVDVTDPNGNNTQNLFNQDDALKGTKSFSNTDNSSGSPYTRVTDTWVSTQANGVYTVSLNKEQKYRYDGTSVNSKITETDYQYDTYGNITKKSELGDISVSGDEKYTYNTYTYNPSLWLVNTVADTYVNDTDDATKVSETWDYYDNNTGLTDSPTKGDLTKEVKWLNDGTNPITQYAYDTYGNQTQVTDANNNTTTVAYGTNDTTNTYPDSTTNAKNQTTNTTYDLGTGNLLSKTDPNGFATTYAYDVFGRISKEIDPYDSSSLPTLKYQYFDGTAPQGTLISKLKNSNASATFDMYTFIDGFGRKLQTRTPAQDTTKQIVTDTFYDPTGQVAKQSVPHLDTLVSSYASPLTGIENTTTTYDPLGRVLSITNPQGNAKTTAYDHWVETNTDENNHQTKNYKDAYNNIIQVDELNGNQTQTTKYVYDPLNNLTKITDANNNNFTFTFDTLGRRITQTDPDVGTWHYTYDGVNNLLTKTDNRNVATTRTYDALNRITKVDYPTDPDVISTYDGNNKIGTLTSVTDAAGTVTYAYDNRLRKTQEQRVMDNTTWTTQFAYDDLDNIISRTNPDGEIINYAFNPQNEIASVSGVLNNINYDALGHITQKTFANGLDTNYSYNSDDFRLNRIQTGTVQDQGYTYDAVGNVASITDNLLTKTQNFVYDSLNRLTGAQEANGYNYTYAYNPIGNLTAFINAGNEIDYSYGQNAGVHAVTSSTEPGPSITPTPTPSQNNSYTIYDEGLGSGWQDWSWSSSNNFTDTAHPNTGSQDFAWTVTTGYGAAYLHNASGVDTTPYTNVTFALRASQSGQQVQVQLYDSSDAAIGNPLQLTNYGGDPVAGSYKTYTIPLAALGGSNKNIHGIAIQDITGNAQPVMDVDTIRLTGSGASSTPTPSPTFTPTPTPTNTTATVYDESLASGWADWSWSATNNFSDTNHPYAGTKDISWTNTAAYGALFFHNAGGFNTANYTSLTFALRATQTGQNAQVQLYDSSDHTIGSPVALTNYGGNPVAGSYKIYTIPLADIGGTNKIINGFIIQDISGAAQPAMYVDSVAFAGTTGSPSPTPTNTPTPTPTPTPSYSLYDESLGSGWQDWSWSSTNNFADTSHPYAGSKDISWVVTAGYAGLFLHNANGFNTTGYNSFTFALRATQTGQNVQVQLYDSSDNTIGSPLQLTNYGGNPVSANYKVYTIPLGDLGGSSKTINGILIQDITGTAQPAMYVDVIGFH